MSKGMERPGRISILALGDSLTAGYGVGAGESLPDVLEEFLDERGYVAGFINAGVSGDTAAGGLARLDRLMEKGFDAAMVEFGTNDALMGLPPGAVQSALEKIIVRLKGQGIEVMLAGASALGAGGPEYDAEFSGIYRELARKYDLELYPFILEGILETPGLTLPDGLHPNKEGVRAMAEGMLPAVIRLVERVLDKKGGARSG